MFGAFFYILLFYFLFQAFLLLKEALPKLSYKSYHRLVGCSFYRNVKTLFERELSLLSRAPSSHWLIERESWIPFVQVVDSR